MLLVAVLVVVLLVAVLVVVLLFAVLFVVLLVAVLVVALLVRRINVFWWQDGNSPVANSVAAVCAP